MAKTEKGYGRDARIKDCLCGHESKPYANGLCRKCYHSKWMNDWYERTKHLRQFDCWRGRNLRVKFRLTVDEYETMLAKQDGVCAICRRPPQKKRLAIDHNHTTGKIRGLLCAGCNTALGRLESSFFPRACEYLKEHNDFE